VVGQDYRLYKRRRVLEILMTYAGSPLADAAGRRLVVEVGAPGARTLTYFL
jgi:hypothetical protein